MPRQTPTTSTVRTALHVAEQFEELLRPGRRGEPIEPADLADSLATVIREGRNLQNHQVDDLVGHLQAIADDEPAPKPQVRLAAVSCAECRRDMTDDTPSDVEGGGQTAADVDPEEARRRADAAAARVRGDEP